MVYLFMLFIVAGAYILGSVPFGLLIVKIRTGQDIRKIESGRTGGTNAMRAAGMWAGLFTGLFDVLKSMVSVLIARHFFPDAYLLHVFTGLAAVVGHNYSIFLTERNEKGRLRLRGGAGGAPTAGGSAGLWFPSILIILPVGALIWYFIGYASVTTLSAGIIITIVFAVRAWLGYSPWEYILYGILAEGILIYALRPNIKRLLSGNERLIGFRARRKRKKAAASINLTAAASSKSPIPSKPNKT